MPPFPVLAQIYLLCAGLGCLAVTWSAVTGAMHHGHGGDAGGGHHFGHGHGDGGHGGHHIGHHQGGHHAHHGDAHGHDASHHSDGSDTQQNALIRGAKTNSAAVQRRPQLAVTILTWFNPTTISAFATWFGITGICLWRMSPLPLDMSWPFAIVGGIGGAKMTMNMVSWLTRRLFESHTFSNDDVIGLEAEVSVPVTATGMGEVMYVKGGRRYTSSARATKSDASFGRGAKTIICDIRDDIAYIEAWQEGNP